MCSESNNCCMAARMYSGVTAVLLFVCSVGLVSSTLCSVNREILLLHTV